MIVGAIQAKQIGGGELKEFRQGKITLLNCDCMEYMAGCGDNEFNLAIIDPPYRDENQPTADMRKNGSMDSICGRPDVAFFDELRRCSVEQIIWGANNFQLPQFKGFVIWKKKTISEDFTMSMCEIASISEGLGTVSKLFECEPQGKKSDPRIHPNMKPIALYKWLLSKYSKPDQRIFDSHLGSGSSAIAAHYFGCEFVGCEIDKDYFNAAVERFKRETRQVDMFQPK